MAIATVKLAVGEVIVIRPSCWIWSDDSKASCKSVLDGLDF